METKKLIGELPKEQIAELKVANPSLYSVQVGDHIAYFKKPNRHNMNYAMSLITDASQPLDYFETIGKETKLAGSDMILEDDDMFMDLVEVLKETLSHKRAVMVKH
jgi:hypothetical protein